jgi:hypothetical protein
VHFCYQGQDAQGLDQFVVGWQGEQLREFSTGVRAVHLAWRAIDSGEPVAWLHRALQCLRYPDKCAGQQEQCEPDRPGDGK